MCNQCSVYGYSYLLLCKGKIHVLSKLSVICTHGFIPDTTLMASHGYSRQIVGRNCRSLQSPYLKIPFLSLAVVENGYNWTSV